MKIVLLLWLHHAKNKLQKNVTGKLPEQISRMIDGDSTVDLNDVEMIYAS